jgi:hypothetical protein
MNLIASQSPALPQCDSSAVNGEALAGAVNEHDQRPLRPFLVCNYITAEEAGCLVNMSRSRVYRLDRNNGPFPIVKIGRRVWIELAGIEAYIAGKQSALTDSDSELPAVPCVEEAQTAAVTEVQQGCPASNVVPAARRVTIHPASFSRVEPTLPAQGTGEGQRGLSFAWGYRPNWC